MAITCSWEKPIGTCYSQYDETKANPLTIWSGGNVLAVITDEHKILYNVIIDERHFKDCEYNGNEYTDIIIYRDRKKESEKLIKLLTKYNFEFTVKRTKEPF